VNTPKSPATQNEVVRLYLDGQTFEDIAKKCGTSIGYVHDKVNKLKEELGQKEASAMREFAVAMRKLGITAPQALVGAKIYSVISKSGLDEDKLGELILEVIEKAQTQQILPSKLIECSKIISDLQERSDVPLEDLPMACHDMLEKKDSLTKEILSLSQQKASAKTDADNALKEKNLTIKKIEEFVSVKTELEKNHIGFNDLQRLVLILKKTSDANYNSDKIINHLQKEESYESRVEKLVQQQKHLQSTIDNQTKKLDDITKEIEEKKTVATAVRNLSKLGIAEQDLKILYQTVMGIANNHNINTKDALQRFRKDIKNNYDKKLGLKGILEKLQNEISEKSTKLKSIQIKEKELQKIHKDRLDVLQTLKRLELQGVEEAKILEWSKIFSSSKLSIAEFSKKIRKAGDLAKTNTALEKSKIQNQKEVEKHESRKKWLEENIDGLESKLHHVDQILKRSLDDFLSDAQEKISTASKYATNTIDETGKKTRENLEAHHRETSGILKDITSELDEFVSKSIEESKKIGKVEWVLEFYEFLMGNNISLSKNIPMITMILERLLYCIKKSNIDSSSLESHIKGLIADLENIMIKND